jgi:hypothetical protein
MKLQSMLKKSLSKLCKMFRGWSSVPMTKRLKRNCLLGKLEGRCSRLRKVKMSVLCRLSNWNFRLILVPTGVRVVRDRCGKDKNND